MASSSSPRALALLAATLVLCAASTHACVYLMGTAKDSLAAKPAGSSWNYALRGDNWQGVDATNKSWSCLTGKHQSPLNLQSSTSLTGAPSLKTTWEFTPIKSNGSDIAVFNNGHTIQVQWTAALKSNVTAYAATHITDVLDRKSNKKLKPVSLTPLQFHFHTNSEHMIDGAFAPIEMHIVHSVPQSVLSDCPPTGCLSVVGILLHVNKNLTAGAPALDTIFNVMSTREGVMEYLPKGATLDIEALMPPRSKRAYLQYEGSLTTPPCTEGLLWHVLKTPVYISLAQYNAYSKAVGLKQCNETSRRRMGEDHHHHHHDHDHVDLYDLLSSFERGSYSGFVHGDELRQGASTHVHSKLSRKLQDDGSSGSDSKNGTYTCEVVAYGWTNRNVQEIGDRTVVAYK